MLLRLALVAAGLILFEQTFPDKGQPLFVFLCLAPFFGAARGAGMRAGLFLGSVAGLVTMFLTYSWVHTGLVSWVDIHGWVAWTVLGLFLAWHALPYAVFGAVLGAQRGKPGVLSCVGTAALFTVLTAFHPKIFPGLHAHMLFDSPLFIQVADLGGVPLVHFFVSLANALAAAAVLGLGRGGSFLRPVLACTLAMGLLTGYGIWRLETISDLEETAPRHLDTAIIQPNLPVFGMEEDVPEEDRNNTPATIIEMTQAVATETPATELFIWPELPVWMSCKSTLTESGVAGMAVNGTAGRVFMQCCESSEGGLSEGYYNIGALYGAGEAIKYRKRELVPFGEYLPLAKRFPKVRELLPGIKRYLPGTSTEPLDLGQGRKLIPAICYEACFPAHIGRFHENGGNVIVSISDDAWFGRGRGADLHFAAALFRAVEYRIPLIRCANSGVSAVVRATGEIDEGTRTPTYVSTTVSRTVAIPDTTTFFPTAHAWIGWALALIAALHVLESLFLNRR